MCQENRKRGNFFFFFLLERGERGCLEGDWALSGTAGAQEEMQRTGEKIG